MTSCCTGYYHSLNVHTITGDLEIRRCVQAIIVAKRVPRRVLNSLHVSCREELDPHVHAVRGRRTAGGVRRVALPDLQVEPGLLRVPRRAEGERVDRVVAFRHGYIADVRRGIHQGDAVGRGVSVGDVEPVGGDNAEAVAGREEVGDAPGRVLGLARDGCR